MHISLDVTMNAEARFDYVAWADKYGVVWKMHEAFSFHMWCSCTTRLPLIFSEQWSTVQRKNKETKANIVHLEYKAPPTTTQLLVLWSRPSLHYFLFLKTCDSPQQLALSIPGLTLVFVASKCERNMLLISHYIVLTGSWQTKTWPFIALNT